MTVVAFVPSLLDRSRFDGRDVLFVASASEVADLAPALVIVDLDRCDDPAPFVVGGASTIGYGSHVDPGRLQAALDVGFTEAAARSVFFQRLDSMLDVDG